MFKKLIQNFRQDPNARLLVNYDGSVRLNLTNERVRSNLITAAKKTKKIKIATANNVVIKD